MSQTHLVAAEGIGPTAPAVADTVWTEHVSWIDRVPRWVAMIALFLAFLGDLAARLHQRHRLADHPALAHARPRRQLVFVGQQPPLRRLHAPRPVGHDQGGDLRLLARDS